MLNSIMFFSLLSIIESVYSSNKVSSDSSNSFESNTFTCSLLLFWCSNFYF